MENLFTVGKLFSDRIFCIPDYQRGYAWEERQCEDLMNDLELLGAGKEHFLGLLILRAHAEDVPRVLSEKGQSFQIYDVVDGQQRLTTIVLFMNALRREMERIDGMRTLALGLEETYVAMRDMNGQPRLKLRLNRDTHAFFESVVLERGGDITGPTIRSHHLLARANRYFAAYLDEKHSKLAEAYPEWLKAEYIKVAQYLTLVVYTADSEADAGVVFETMNNRGQALTELEKVKNYLLYLASKVDLPAEHGLEARINDTWTYIFEHLTAAGLGSLRNEDQLLRAHWLMAYDYDPKKWDGSRSVKDRFNLRKYKGEHPALLDDLGAYLTSLRSATVAYCDVFHPAHSNAFANLQMDRKLCARCVSWGVRLVRLGVPVTFLPLLMAVRIRYPEDASAYLETLQLCEKFAFRVYRWMEKRAYTGQPWMFRMGNQLFQGRDLNATMDEIRDGILYYGSDRAFESRFEQEGMDWYHWRGLKYMLYEYEQYLAEKAGQAVRIPWEEIEAHKQDTVEHILPQSIEGNEYWIERFTPEQHKRYAHDIGNLTLTYDNPSLGTKPFPTKKGSPKRAGCYASSKLFVEQGLACYDDWTEAEILARRQEIAKWAMTRWQVERLGTKDAGALRTEDGGGEIDRVVEIQAVLTRRFIPYGQMSVYHALYQAGNDWVTSSELAEAVRTGDTNALAGVLGALGVRINNTGRFKREKPGIKLLFEVEWRKGELYYRMKPETRTAIDDLAGLQEVMTWPLDEIKTRYEEEWEEDWAAQQRQLGL